MTTETRREARASEDITQMAVSLFDRVREIKRTHPAIARAIDKLETEIRDRLALIQRQIAKLERPDQDLVTVLVINGLHRTADEVLIERE